MEVRFRGSFDRDIKKVRDADLLRRVDEKIEEIEGADSLYEVSAIANLRTRDSYYRVRVGDYRMYLVREGAGITLTRFLHRSDAY